MASGPVNKTLPHLFGGPKEANYRICGSLLGSPLHGNYHIMTIFAHPCPCKAQSSNQGAGCKGLGFIEFCIEKGVAV